MSWKSLWRSNRKERLSSPTRRPLAEKLCTSRPPEFPFRIHAIFNIREMGAFVCVITTNDSRTCLLHAWLLECPYRGQNSKYCVLSLFDGWDDQLVIRRSVRNLTRSSYNQQHVSVKGQTTVVSSDAFLRIFDAYFVWKLNTYDLKTDHFLETYFYRTPTNVWSLPKRGKVA